MRINRHLIGMLLIVILASLPGLSASGANVITLSPRLNADQAAAPTPAERAAARANIAAWMGGLAAEAPGTPTTSAQARLQTAQWTVMIYLAADNDLEEFGIGDVNEMEVVGSTTGVNVIVQMDRATGYDRSNGDWTDTRRLFIERDDDFDVINSEVVETIGETATGDPQTLVDFATWSMDTYPAQHYALILWDHGGSWLGIATDASADDDDLSMPELGDALAQITAANGGQPLDLIGFDACLMGELEVYSTVAPYAQVAVGAEESIPGFGWEYATPLQALARDPSLDAEALGRSFVDSFMDFYTEVVTYYDQFDLGAVRLGATEEVISALDGFVSTVEANPGAVLSAIGDARNNTIVFGGFDDPEYFDIWSAADLIQFMQLLGTFTTTHHLLDAAAAADVVVAAAEDMVIHHRANDGLAGAQGISIYFPRNELAYNQYGIGRRYQNENPGNLQVWQHFLDVFFGAATTTVSEAPQVNILGVYPEVASIYEPAVIQMDVSGQNLMDVSFGAMLQQEDGTQILVEYERLISRTTTVDGSEVTDWADGVTTRTYSWDTEIPIITDGQVETPALLIQNRNSPSSAVVDGQYIPADGDPVDAQLVYDLATSQVETVWGVRETPNGYVPFELAVNNGDQFQPYWLYLDAANNLQHTLADVTLTFGDDPFTFHLVPAPSGAYSLTIVAEDLAGTTASDSVEIQVNNTGLDPAQRGFTDPQFGLNFRYPAGWIEPRFIATDEGGRLFTGDPATGIVLSVLPYDGVSSAQDVAQQVIDSWNVLEDAALVDQQEVSLGTYNAYVVDYTYTLQGTQRAGVVLAIYAPERAIGYGFDVDAPADQVDAASTAFNVLVDSLNFFDTQATLGSSDWQVVEAANGLASYAVPAAWQPTQLEAWQIYSPAGYHHLLGLPGRAWAGPHQRDAGPAVLQPARTESQRAGRRGLRLGAVLHRGSAVDSGGLHLHQRQFGLGHQRSLLRDQRRPTGVHLLDRSAGSCLR